MAGATTLLGGCAHSLDIKNLDAYRAHGLAQLDRPLTIGIQSDSDDTERCRLLDGVAAALGRSSAQVVMPYGPNSQKPVDVIAAIDIQTRHEGSGWNFLINWPGFLIWTPAWNGYIYEVNYTVNGTLIDAATKKPIDQFQLPIALDIRHADTHRTWTEISWLEVSAIAFVGGLLFMDYDEAVTPLVSDRVETPLGKHIAHEVVNRINASGQFAPLPPAG